MAPKTDGVGNLVEFLAADVFELLTLGGELLIYLDGFFRHNLMGLFGAAQEDKIRAGSQAFMTVGIQAEAQHHGFPSPFAFTHIRHEARLLWESDDVNQL